MADINVAYTDSQYMHQFPEIWLQAGDVIPRDDGRFYVPVRDLHRPDEYSAVVFRIASDAFGTVEEAELFAELLVSCWNSRSVKGNA